MDKKIHPDALLGNTIRQQNEEQILIKISAMINEWSIDNEVSQTMVDIQELITKHLYRKPLDED